MTDKKSLMPVLHISGETLPEVWEKAVQETWGKGIAARTQYDKPDDPPSREATVVMEVRRPAQEPRIHRSFPAGLEELEIYRQEVVSGVHDSWIDPADHKWSYTYHQRLFNYDVIDNFKDARSGGVFDAVNQIEKMADELSACNFTRRAQAITWMPTVDIGHADPPCLQRIWARLIAAENEWVLNINTHWRSRDAYKAAFMNMYALTDLQRLLAGMIAEKSGRKVSVGSYIDISDSFHIYGSYFNEFKENFLKLCEKRTFEERVWRTADVEYSLIAGKAALLNGKPGEPPLTRVHRARILSEIPPEYHHLVDEKIRAELAGE